MSLREQITEHQKKAMKEKNTLLLLVLRGVLSDVKNKEIEVKKELDDVEVQKIISKKIKQNKDAILDFKRGDRKDLVEKAEQENKILESYMPEQISEVELEEIIKNLAKELNISDKTEMGRLMGAVMKKLGNAVDGNLVRQKVNQILQ